MCKQPRVTFLLNHHKRQFSRCSLEKPSLVPSPKEHGRQHSEVSKVYIFHLDWTLLWAMSPQISTMAAAVNSWNFLKAQISNFEVHIYFAIFVRVAAKALLNNTIPKSVLDRSYWLSRFHKPKNIVPSRTKNVWDALLMGKRWVWVRWCVILEILVLFILFG